MIVPDLNLLLYAVFDGFLEHPRARRWWEETLSGREAVGLAGLVLFSCLRLWIARWRMTVRLLLPPPVKSVNFRLRFDVQSSEAVRAARRRQRAVRRSQ